MRGARRVFFTLGVMVVTAAPAAAQPIPGAGAPCASDDECPRGTICSAARGRCARVRQQINVLYLLYRSTDRRFTEVGGLYWHRRGRSGFRVVFPLYWSFWSPGEQRRVLAPCYFDRRTARDRHLVLPPFELRRSAHERSLRVWPLVFHARRSAESYSTTVLPFAHVSRSGARRTVVLPPALSFARTDARRELSQGMVAGLVHWKATPKRLSLGVLPLFWHKRGPRYRFTWVAPLNVHYADDSARILFALPLLAHLSTAERSTTLGLVPLPLYHHRSEGKRRFCLPPVTLYRRTGERWLFALGPTWVRRSPDGGGFGALPLLADWNARRRWVVLFPALWHHRDARRDTWVVGPGFWTRAGADDWGGGLAPLLFAGQRGDRRHLGLLPMFWHSATTGRSTTWVAPLSFYRRVGQRRSLVLAPLLFYGSSPPRRHLVLAPLLWHFRSPHRATWCFGPAYYHRDGVERDAGLAPLVFYRQRPWGRSLTVAPLLHHGVSADGARRRLLSPLVLYDRDSVLRRTRLALLAPLPYLRQRDPERAFDALLPLFARWRDGRGDERLTVAGPLLSWRGRHTSTLAALPLAFASWRRGAAAEHHRVAVLPLLYTARRGGRRSLYTPLFGFRRDEARRRSAWYAGPLVASRSPHGSLHALVPLFWAWRSPSASTTIAAPLLWDVHHPAVSRTTFVFPLYLRHRDAAAGSTTHATPLGWMHRGADGTDAVLFPAFWRFASATRSTTVVFPLAWDLRRPGRRTTVVFPVYWDFTRGARRTTVVLNTLYRRNAAKRTYDLHVLPLFRVQRKRPRDLKLSFVAGLFGYERAGRNRTLKLLLVPVDISR